MRVHHDIGLIPHRLANGGHAALGMPQGRGAIQGEGARHHQHLNGGEAIFDGAASALGHALGLVLHIDARHLTAFTKTRLRMRALTTTGVIAVIFTVAASLLLLVFVEF